MKTRGNSPVDAVYEHVKRQIITKELFPGNRIVEEELARETQVSRTSIRTALTRLRYEGFVDTHANRGTFVARPTIEDIRVVYETRSLLEGEAIRLAAARMTGEGLARMEENLERQRELRKNFSILQYVSLNREFHWEFIQAAGNPYYEKYLNELFNKSGVYLMFFDSSVDNSGSLVNHSAILDALKRGDGRAAREAVWADNRLGIADTHSEEDKPY